MEEKTKRAPRQRTRVKLNEPMLYRVIMHNDDITTMDFVVDILKEIFKKPEGEAVRLMYLVHNSGQAKIAVYPYDIAITKVTESMARAKSKGFPFKMTTEPEK